MSTATRPRPGLVAAREARVPAALRGFARALPPGRSQREVWDGFFAEHYEHKAWAREVWLGAGVEYRHGVADPMAGVDVRAWTTAERMRAFVEAAVPLGVKAVSGAMAAAELDPADVGQLTVACCTGYATPGLDILVASELGLDPGVQRLHVGHMGCYAALPALATATDAAVARGRAAVVLCLELPSLHIQPPTRDLQQLVAHALFADAAAAVVVGAGGGRVPGLEWVDVVARTDPASAALMSWEVTDHGFRMGLSPKVPKVLAGHVGPAVGELLSAHGLRTGDVAGWAIHPGGPAILEVVAEQLGLPDAELAAARETLRTVGNCSSATVLMVLEELLATRDLSPGDPVVAMAFGPGLTLYAALLRAT